MRTLFCHKTKPATLLLVILATAGCFLRQVKAADPTVNATLSSDTTEVGQAVELNIQVNGAQRAQVPEKIDVDGLTILHSGQQTQFQMQNFNVSSSVVHTFTVVPDRAGKFAIPAITVEVDGKKLTTPALSLTATGSGNNTGGTASSAAPGSNEPKSDGSRKIAFAELVVPAQNAYVGEAIPIEIRVYFDANVRVQTDGLPTLTSEGFTVQKLTQPHQEQVVKNGRRYNFVSYKTAITPVKSGKLVLGPAELQYVAVVPQSRKAPRNGMDDFFSDEMLNNMFGGYVQEQLTVKSNESDMEVKPLPKTGQPKDFSGAVGQFSLSTEASPLKLNLGDPVTLKLKISGRGNFDLVSAPHMLEETGWRSYPPSNKFTADDDVGISGSKVFEMAVIPADKKTRLPAVEFSYFDPLTEKYVTLNAERTPITVEGQSTPVPVVQASPSGQEEKTPEAAKSGTDIHYILTGAAHWDKSFEPVFLLPVFWKSQGAPLLAFLAFVGFQVQCRRKRDLIAMRLAELRRQKGDLLKAMQREDTDAATFYEAATRYFQIEAGSSSSRNPASITTAEIISMRPLDAATSDAVRSIFAAHEELHYAGDAATRQKASSAQRQKVLETLKKFEDAQA